LNAPAAFPHADGFLLARCDGPPQKLKSGCGLVTTMASIEPLLNEHEVAARLGVSVATLRKWRWSGGGLRFIRVGRCIRYSVDELRNYIEQQTRTSTSDRGAG